MVAAFGGLDTVVACAGLAYPGTTDGMGLDAWDTMIRVNLTGVFLTVRAAVPHLLEAGGGAIVTIGSTASLVASGQSSAYDASKGGVLQFTRSVAVEYVDARHPRQLRLPRPREHWARREHTPDHRPGRYLREAPAAG